MDNFYVQDTNYKAFRSSITTADTLTTTALLALPAYKVNGHTTLLLGARFTNASDTVTVQPVYVYKLGQATSDTDVTTYTLSNGDTVKGNVIKGYGPAVTLTAGTTQYEGAYYLPVGGDYFFDTGRAITVRLAVITGPAHSVTFWLGS
jgi:hypothetical protein